MQILAIPLATECSSDHKDNQSAEGQPALCGGAVPLLTESPPLQAREVGVQLLRLLGVGALGGGAGGGGGGRGVWGAGGLVAPGCRLLLRHRPLAQTATVSQHNTQSTATGQQDTQ